MSVPDQASGPGESPVPPDQADTDAGARGPVTRRSFLRTAAGEAANTAVAASVGNVTRVGGVIGQGSLGLNETRLRDAEALARAAGVTFNDVVVLDEGVPGGRPAGAADAGQPGPTASPAVNPATSAPAGAAPAQYRSPYRIDGDTLIVLDQRRFPGAVLEIPCFTAGDAAAAIREGLAQGAGTVAAVGAYGLAAATATRARSTDGPATAAEAMAACETDAATLLSAAPWVVPLRNILASLVAEARNAATAAGAAGATGGAAPGQGGAAARIAASIRRHADEAFMAGLLEQSRLVAAAVGLLGEQAAARSNFGHPLRVLIHGPVGSLGFGQLGSALAAVQGAARGGIPVQAWLDEGQPGLSGVRNAWELNEAGVGYWLIHDAAVGGVLAGGSIDLVLGGALGVTPDGSVVDEPGAYAIAALAARHGVPVYVCVPRAGLFAETLFSSPRFDVAPADLIAGLITDAGILKPPFGPALAAIAPPGPAGF